MNIKSNKGYVAIDASIAVLILLLMIPTIAGMVYNVSNTENSIYRETEAISVAVNSIEATKEIGISNLEDDTNTSESEPLKLVADKLDSLYDEKDAEGNDKTTESDLDITNLDELILTKNENTYKIEITIKDYADTTEGDAEGAIRGYVKIVDVKVTYRVGKQDKSIELSTAIS